IGIADERVAIERRRVDELADTEQLAPLVDEPDPVKRIAQRHVRYEPDRSRGDANDDAGAIAHRRGSEQRDEQVRPGRDAPGGKGLAEILVTALDADIGGDIDQ